jgi:hypothetical protein
MLVGFAGLGFAGYRASRGNILLIGGVTIDAEKFPISLNLPQDRQPQ